MLSHQYQQPVAFNDPAPKVSFDLITGRPNVNLVTHPQARESNPDRERDFSTAQVR